MIIIRVLGGRVSKSGKLTLLTVLKLQLALISATRLQARGIPYEYAFPQGRKNDFDKSQRPCDVMSLWILRRDPHGCRASVPAADIDLVTPQERLNFVKQVALQRQAGVIRQRDFRKIKGMPNDDVVVGADDSYLASLVSQLSR